MDLSPSRSTSPTVTLPTPITAASAPTPPPLEDQPVPDTEEVDAAANMGKRSKKKLYRVTLKESTAKYVG